MRWAVRGSPERPGSRSPQRRELNTPSPHRTGGARVPGATLARPPQADAFEHEYPGARWLDMRVMRQLELAGAKADALITKVARRYGLSHAALNALAVIEGAGGPVPAGRVSTQMHISTATMTSVLDTLERNGYIQRQPDPGDRRRVLVDVTAAAEALLDQVLPAVQQVVTAALSPLGDETLDALLQALTAASDALEIEPDELPSPPARRTPPQLRRARQAAAQ
jgi:DNA-binding MarR family transcriptional regulator